MVRTATILLAMGVLGSIPIGAPRGVTAAAAGAEPDAERRSANQPPAAAKDAKQPAARQASVNDLPSLAAVLRPRLPKGWTLTSNANEVVIRRNEPVEVFNAINLPAFDSDDERREYVRKDVISEPYVVRLSLGEPVSAAEYERAKAKNRQAADRAQREAKHPKQALDEHFWKEHPEYGLRALPSYDTGSRSVYMDLEPSMGVFEFWSADVAAECQGVLDDLAKMFRPYESE